MLKAAGSPPNTEPGQRAALQPGTAGHGGPPDGRRDLRAEGCGAPPAPASAGGLSVQTATAGPAITCSTSSNGRKMPLGTWKSPCNRSSHLGPEARPMPRDSQHRPAWQAKAAIPGNSHPTGPSSCRTGRSGTALRILKLTGKAARRTRRHHNLAVHSRLAFRELDKNNPGTIG